MNFRTKVVVRYAETDQMGIAHHSVYPVWYELARTEFIKTVGIKYSELEQLGVMTPLVKLECKYIRPALYEDELEIEVNVEELTGVKIIFVYKIYKSGVLVNEGKTVHALVGKDLKPINIKKKYPDIHNILMKLMD